jgi:hypothetical protein
MPDPKDVHLPTLPETRLDEIDSEPESRYSEQVDPSLLNLRAAGYRGTFKQAYSILTEMTAKIGWDQLLKIRSNVFVMEDEYRNEKPELATPAKRNASTDALRGTPDPNPVNGDATDDEDEDEDEDDDDAGEKKTSKGPDADSLAPTLVPNGQTDDALEKPTSTVDPDEIRKSEGETVCPFYFLPSQPVVSRAY